MGRYVDTSSHVEPGAHFDCSTGKSQAVSHCKDHWNDHDFKAPGIIADATANHQDTLEINLTLQFFEGYALYPSKEVHNA